MFLSIRKSYFLNNTSYIINLITHYNTVNMTPKKRAISTVLTTIIILVASVVLGSGVVLYGTSLFQGAGLTESITVSGLSLWVHDSASDGLAWGAFSVRNSGDKLVSMDKISIRGNDVPFNQWYVDTTMTNTVLQQQVNFTGWSNVGGMLAIDGPDDCAGGETVQVSLIAGSSAEEDSFCANAATGPTGLEPGAGVMIYFKLTNGTLTSIDNGVTTSVNIFAGKTGAPLSIAITGKS